MSAYLHFDGRRLRWYPGAMVFRACSGLPGWQDPKHQCRKDTGPIPQGKYRLLLRFDPNVYAVDDGTGRCNLRASRAIQQIPRGDRAGVCEPYWSNWGWNRVRLEPADSQTAGACGGRRGGFYLHDSSKGFTHGCIEVERGFFERLAIYMKTTTRRRSMTLVVSYRYAAPGG